MNFNAKTLAELASMPENIALLEDPEIKSLLEQVASASEGFIKKMLSPAENISEAEQAANQRIGIEQVEE